MWPRGTAGGGGGKEREKDIHRYKGRNRERMAHVLVQVPASQPAVTVANVNCDEVNTASVGNQLLRVSGCSLLLLLILCANCGKSGQESVDQGQSSRSDTRRDASSLEYQVFGEIFGSFGKVRRECFFRNCEYICVIFGKIKCIL